MKQVTILVVACAFGALLSVPAHAQLSVRIRLDGNQAGTVSPGTGTGWGTFSPDFHSLTYRITVAHLQGAITGAHFHFTPTGGILQAITFSGNTATGTWTGIPDSLLKYVFNGGIYVNIHTTADPAGEISGRLNATQFFFTVALDSTGTGSGSSATGTGWIRWRDGGGVDTALNYTITFSGLSGTFTGAHFHLQPDGTILQGITFLDSATASGTWSSYPDSIIALLLHRRVYVNVHSSAFPNGEIRGTVTPAGGMTFVAGLDGAQAGTASPGLGTAWAMLSPDMSTITYHATYVNLLAGLTGSHFHTATNGSIIHGVTFTGNTTAGTWTGFSDTNLQDLLLGRVYLNLHTSAAPAGEIQGRFYTYDGGFAGALDGAQAGTSSLGTGTVWAHFGSQDDSLRYRATFTGLSGTYTASHFHTALSGRVVMAAPSPDSANVSGAWMVPDSLIAEMVRGQIYFNVHSTAFPNGDIRATLQIGAGGVTSVAVPPVDLPRDIALQQNYPNPFNPSTTIGYRLNNRGHVILTVYDLLGREIRVLVNGEQPAGAYQVRFDAGGLASGLYFYRLQAGQYVDIRKMVLLK